MQVLGDLIALPMDRPGVLPLPWWHRAPLGFQSGTRAYVAFVPSGGNRACGDIFLSLLNPNKWRETVNLYCKGVDQPGFLSAAISSAADANIALAESITCESGERHELSMVIEGGDHSAIVDRLSSKGFSIGSVYRFPDRKIDWAGKGIIEEGWINRKWRDKFTETYGSADGFPDVDLSRAVISADTSNRLMRFTFPKVGAQTVHVEHVDKPGVLREIARVFESCHCNVLSLLLRRGGALPGNAIAVAVCEPVSHNGAPSQLKHALSQQLALLPVEYEIEASFPEARSADSIIIPSKKNTVVSGIPPSLLKRVEDVRETQVGKPISIFLSRRFVSNDRATRLANEVKDAIEDSGCGVLEADPSGKSPTMIYEEVTSKMWASDACVVLVADLKNNGVSQDTVGKNLPHEFGFMQGQGKPLILLLDGDDNADFQAWTNIGGIFAPRIPTGDAAFIRNNDESIYAQARSWALQVVKSIGS